MAANHNTSFDADEEKGLKGLKEAELSSIGDGQYSLDDAEQRGSGPQQFGKKTKAQTEVRDHVQQVIDETEGLQKPTIVRNLAIAYIISVVVVILLSIGGQVAVQLVVDNSESDSLIVNIAGRQRMLSQLISKDVSAIAYILSTEGNITYYLDELRDRSELWKESHYGLWKGSSELGLPGTSAKDIVANFEELDVLLTTMYNAVNVILANVSSSTTSLSPNISSEIQVILANERLFLPLMDKTVVQFQNAANTHLKFVLILTWVLHGLVVVTLLLEGLFLFRPVLRKMQELINERFGLMRKTLVSEAESSGVSLLMMSYIGNELKTPLRAVEDYLDSAVQSIRSHAEREVKHDFVLDGMRADCLAAIEYIRDTNVCLGLMDTVANDVVNMHTMEMGRMNICLTSVDVVNVLRQVARLVDKKVKAGVVLEFSVGDSIQNDSVRQLDRQRLLQILINLVNHAISVTKEGTISMEVKETFNNEKLRIEVLDNGPSLDPDEQDDVFQPVMGSPSTSKNGKSGSSGLSLYIVRMLAELLGGVVGIEMVTSGGNLLWVEIPAAKVSQW